MKIERALRIRQAGESALRDCYSAASIFGSTSADMEARRREALERIGVYKAPHWVLSYLDGYWRAMIAQAYQSDLVFGGMVDGAFRSTHSDRDDYYEKHGIGPSAYADNGAVKERGHYWKRNLRPFFIA